MGFNAETYWADKPVKKFSIVLRNGTAEQNMIVAARNEDAARDAAFKRSAISLQRHDDTALTRWQSVIAWLAGDLPR